MGKSDSTKDPIFQKVAQVFLNTPHQPHKPTKKKAKSPCDRAISHQNSPMTAIARKRTSDAA